MDLIQEISTIGKHHHLLVVECGTSIARQETDRYGRDLKVISFTENIELLVYLGSRLEIWRCHQT